MAAPNKVEFTSASRFKLTSGKSLEYVEDVMDGMVFRINGSWADESSLRELMMIPGEVVLSESVARARVEVIFVDW